MSETVTSQAQQVSTNVKETIESILVAFILAFIFRAYVVEAFVIPTGSMAPTLLGAHMTFRCPDCGYVFDVNYAHGDSDDMNFPSSSLAPDDIYCPNCGYHIANGPLRDQSDRMVRQPARDEQGNYITDADGNRVYQPVYPGGTQQEQVHYGDRILVLKYAYLFNPPRRWDVVVFKAPAQPELYHYTQNFIKRLVGLPGETLMVLDGDLYAKDERGDWMIQQRPLSVQNALWRIVYDNDFYPQGLTRSDRSKSWTQPWKLVDGQGWNLGHGSTDGRVFHFDGQAAGTIGFDSDANGGSQTTNDYLVYDIPVNQRRPSGGDWQSATRNVVSDLKLSLWYQRQSGSGPLNLRLTKRDHAFDAEIGPDAVTLWHTHPDGTRTADAGPVKLADAGIKPGSPIWVEFMNVDYKVTLYLNGKPALQTTLAQYAPDADELLKEYNDPSIAWRRPPEIQITCADQSSALSHVGLWRDIYYTNANMPGLMWATPSRPVHLHRRGEAREDGGVYNEDEYFVMGDNSLISGDARFWTERIDLPNEDLEVESGRVPDRFLLGKAFFVYWPAGFRPASGWPALVPDFGDMRFIH
jgi:signal peptidase I